MMDRTISPRYRWKVKGRLAVLEYAAANGVKPAAARFGLDRKTIRAWRTRAGEAGPAGLVPRYPARRRRRIPGHVVELIAHARQEFQWGACRTRIWLMRVDQVKVATATISRICDDLGLPRVRRAKQVLEAFPFPIRKIQTDRGPEFPFTFMLTVERRGIRYRYIQPRRPDQNGKVERSHRIDAEEFWERHTFDSFDAAAAALIAWERVYNEERFSMALKGRTPAEKLAAVLAAA